MSQPQPQSLTSEERQQLLALIRRAARSLTPVEANLLLGLVERDRTATIRTLGGLTAQAKRLRQQLADTEQKVTAALSFLTAASDYVHPSHAIDDAIRILNGKHTP